VANGADNTITEYGQGAFGNVSPLTVLGGADGLDGPNGIAIDPSGTVYVAEADKASITVHGLAGGPPARIAGPTTGLATPAGLALDDAGRLYVADPAANAVDVFAAGATGDARPVATIAGPHTGLSTPTAVTVIGTNVWVANANGNSLTEYRTFNNGDVTPAATIAGPGTALQHPVALAQDGAGHLLAANEFGESVTEYVPGNPQPIATIFGPATQLSFPDGIDVDTAGRIYVANQFGGVNAFAPGADGDVAPVGIVSGGATRLSAPGALAATPPLSILAGRLPHGRAGRRYRFRLRAGEGTTPYRWSLARGRLPRGLRLRRSGVIAGRPPHAGRRRIVVRVRDASHQRAHATRRLVLRVRARS
jgi:sugar lactone lactonase YvrE